MQGRTIALPVCVPRMHAELQLLGVHVAGSYDVNTHLLLAVVHAGVDTGEAHCRLLTRSILLAYRFVCMSLRHVWSGQLIASHVIGHGSLKQSERNCWANSVKPTAELSLHASA